MAAMATCARDIPKPFGRDSFAAVAARSVPVVKTQPLPTPPNSISPNLPPHGKPYGTRSASAQIALEHVESDLELGDGQTGSEKEAFTEKNHKAGSPGFDAAGSITPSLLAKHHLPEILLDHGPLAIRHIMGYLTTSVPGFSGVPPAKARRLVVGALEGRGSGGEGGGLRGEVKFEKVGWGRWDAKLKGQHARNSRTSHQSPPPSAPSSYSTGMPITKGNAFKHDRNRLNVPGSSWAGDSAVFSHDDDIDINMLEDQADRMSLDGGESYTSSEAPPEDEIMDDDPEDITDDEDWAAVGAAALRAASYSASGPGQNFLNSRLYPGGSHGGGGPSLNTLAKSVPLQPSQLHNNLDLSAYGMTSDSQEREAIEALLRLGSV
ncbi:putative Sin3 binding protein-domain-containing protein [Halenospora varia]|nr:putative Sin3 binding protein-domain-containing protein [Halenospora varia]